jgi:hypothetical protein
MLKINPIDVKLVVRDLHTVGGFLNILYSSIIMTDLSSVIYAMNHFQYVNNL